jgi:hypothetical protein
MTIATAELTITKHEAAQVERANVQRSDRERSHPAQRAAGVVCGRACRSAATGAGEVETGRIADGVRHR